MVDGLAAGELVVDESAADGATEDDVGAVVDCVDDDGIELPLLEPN